MNRARALPAGGLDLEEQVSAVRTALEPTTAEDYFLARMTYRYLAPTDEVALISMPAGGHLVTEVVVALTDEAGERYTVRGPVSPREVARLLHMFHESNLYVTFTAEHEFLLCLDAKETVIGGLFYRQITPGAGRHGEAGGRPQAPRQGRRRRPGGRVRPPARRARRAQPRDGLLPAGLPAPLRLPDRPHLGRPGAPPRSPAPSRCSHDQVHLEAHRLDAARGRAVRAAPPSAPRTSSRSPARWTPSASSTSR